MTDTAEKRPEGTGKRGFSQTEGERGTIFVAESVLVALAEYAAWQVQAIRPARGSFAETLAGVFGGHNRGVEVEVGPEGANFTLRVVLTYGEPVHLIAKQIQQRVIAEVEKMTEISVACVDVFVEDLDFERSEEASDFADEPNDDLAAGILEAIAERPGGLTLPEIGEVLDVDWRRLTSVISDLVERGDVKKSGKRYGPSDA